MTGVRTETPATVARRPRGVANAARSVDTVNATTPPKPGVKMTIEIYTVDRRGEVIQDRGTVVTLGLGKTPLPTGCAWPPCECPRCRSGRAVTR